MPSAVKSPATTVEPTTRAIESAAATIESMAAAIESVASTKAAKVAAAKASHMTATKPTHVPAPETSHVTSAKPTKAMRESQGCQCECSYRCQNCDFYSHNLTSIKIKLPMIRTCASFLAKHRANFVRTYSLGIFPVVIFILCHASISRFSDSSFQKNGFGARLRSKDRTLRSGAPSQNAVSVCLLSRIRKQLTKERLE
jgi:hypothetical protein